MATIDMPPFFAPLGRQAHVHRLLACGAPTSVFQCMVVVLACCRLALQGQLGFQARVHLLASLLAVSFVQLPFTLMRLTLMV